MYACIAYAFDSAAKQRNITADSGGGGGEGGRVRVNRGKVGSENNSKD